MKRAKHCLAIKNNYNKGVRNLKRLTPSQPVYYQYKEGRRPEWRRGTMQTEHSKQTYIIDGRDGVYRRNRVHLCPTTPETSPEKSSSPASALNSHKPLEHMDTEVAGCQQTEQVSSRQSYKATANQEGTWLAQRLQVQLLVSWTFVHVPKNLYLTIKETLRHRTELVRVIHLCFILFYYILFEREGCWYITMSLRVGWNCKGLETIYDMCIWPAMFF